MPSIWTSFMRTCWSRESKSRLLHPAILLIPSNTLATAMTGKTQKAEILRYTKAIQYRARNEWQQEFKDVGFRLIASVDYAGLNPQSFIYGYFSIRNEVMLRLSPVIIRKTIIHSFISTVITDSLPFFVLEFPFESCWTHQAPSILHEFYMSDRTLCVLSGVTTLIIELKFRFLKQKGVDRVPRRHAI